MKVVILAGGKGTRITEETKKIPKPMIKIGSMPILWHIMKIYSFYGFNDFIICCGYKKKIIIDFFKQKKNLYFGKNHFKKIDPNWKVNCIDTGLETATGGRLLKISKHLQNSNNFLMTYGDGLSDINIHKLINYHIKNNKLATVSATNPPSRFGLIKINKRTNIVKNFNEKPNVENDWINGGFFVLNKKVLEFIPSYSEAWENIPMKTICNEKQLVAFKHNSFWQPMDTLRERNLLNDLYKKKKSPLGYMGK